ncbi:htrA-like peptidase. Serine peptidase. MEROPS family S01B [Pelagirhabdus alkalitolerans]|uniref:HtrA-like peptidase. Serine peptidase. MEROPS family S01B n=1 Tax=Pelagirhabdus alkalitolerans TaxID=1612202 RepID=A0A1G6JHB8_9BACI|nr:trypsin-like peptidase domain-containing protein [Pelagirhabdus alkalitolerans]SDC18120.1 htrA-like peptidase. Serine peptidase. MEROPS family S01B [Pelagirhabdus alkalitolerans]
MNEFHDPSQDEKQEENSNYESHNPIETKQKNNPWSIWLSGITGGITVAIIGFLLLFTGFIPLHTPEQTEEDLQTDSTDHQLIQTTTGDDGVSEEVLSNVSGAVVGVANIQATDLWSDAGESGQGSGVIYKIENDRAFVVTNHHVIEGANEVEVILQDEERVEAQLHGSDDLTDLAVLSIDAEHASTVAEFGSSSDLTVGQSAIAIGNPLGTEFAGTVTKGIISGLDRSLEVDLSNDGTADWVVDVIQTDAAINPGNSGGALINSSGEVIGINSMKIALGTVEGIGFAIPIDEAEPVIEQLETEGSVTRPFMGISAIDFSSVPPQHIDQTLNLDPNEITSGIVVAEVQPDSSAADAGLAVYDVITDIDGEPIHDMMDLRQYLYSETEVGETITITYYRDGAQEQTDVTLEGE